MTYRSSLLAVIDAVSFVNDVQFSWFGDMSAGVDRAVHRRLTRKTARAFLRAQLRGTLYRNFYLTGSPKPYTSESSQTAFMTELTFAAALDSASKGGGTLQHRWTVVGTRAGFVKIERLGLVLEVPYTKCSPLIHNIAASSTQVSLILPNCLPKRSPGFYLVLGNRAMPDDGRVLRIYWHLTSEGAPTWVKHVTETLNDRDLAFILKTVSTPRSFGRCDAGVLYLPRQDFDVVREPLTYVYERVRHRMRSAVPAFTKALAPGVGVAESPSGGKSFGLHRCDLLAEGLICAAERGKREPAERLECIRDAWAAESLQIDTPYLNPRCADTYEAFHPRARALSKVLKQSTEQEPATITPLDCLDIAAKIAHSLKNAALWSGERCTWIGPELSQSQMVGHRTLPADLYSGTAGVGLFLATLTSVTHDKKIRHASLCAFRQAFATQKLLGSSNVLSLFTGALGVSWAATRASVILENEELMKAARTQLKDCRSAAGSTVTKETDLLAGRAGSILGLLYLSEILGDDSLLQWAAQLGTTIAEEADCDSAGRFCWRRTDIPGAPALTGYSHGAAGIGIALFELGSRIDSQTLRNAGLAAFSYERQYFDPVKRNWPDFRSQTKNDSELRRTFMSGWCHGAPGIALSRFRASRFTADPQISAERNTAIDTTERDTGEMLQNDSTNYCLCHGLAGNAEILSICAEGQPPPTAWKVAQFGKQSYAKNSKGWPCGLRGVSSPGLMLGTAGIGHFYLRLFAPSIPSVLLPYSA